MKRALILVMLAATIGAAAQWGDYGVRLAIGGATITDDLSTHSPIFATNIGGYINFTFEETESALADLFYLQGGLNLVRRGNNFREVLETTNNMMVRTGYNHAWYAQIPILACLHMELPIRQRGHVVGVFLGPAFNIGLFGEYGDRKITPGITSAVANYDIHVNGTAEDRAAFNHLRRFDISAVFGFSYEYKSFTLSAFVDHGFIPTSSGEDILRIIERNQLPDDKQNTVKVNIPNGYNAAFMLSISYQLGSLMKKIK